MKFYFLTLLKEVLIGKIDMKFIIGKKIEMTQLYRADGTVVPVTKINAGPCFVLQKKTADGKDGYFAVKCAYEETKKKVNKPMSGIFMKLGGRKFKILKEFRFKQADATFEKLNIGDEIKVNIFQIGDKVTVTGFSKGRGFQGVVKRHNFKGGKRSHGNKDQERMPGSCGAVQPKHVWKGKRRPGRMGNEQVTISGLEVIDIEPEKNLIYLHGCVPGARNGLVFLTSKGDFEIKPAVTEEVKSVEQSEAEIKEEKADIKKEESSVVDKK